MKIIFTKEDIEKLMLKHCEHIQEPEYSMPTIKPMRHATIISALSPKTCTEIVSENQNREIYGEVYI